METGYNVVTELPPGYKPDFAYFLFGQPRHLALQGTGWSHFYLIKKTNKKVMAQVSFHLANHLACSPLRAPFGSFHFSEHVMPQTLFEFVHQVEQHLIKEGVSIITLTEPPSVYRKKEDLLHTILLNQGYRISNAELSSYIRIDRLSFEEKIEVWEKRKFKQGKQLGLAFRQLPLDDLKPVYNFIHKCREQRSQTLSMTFEELAATVDSYPNEFVISAVYVKEEITAASIAIKVHRNILYNFYSGHLKKYDSVSPVVTLISGLYKYCEKQNIQILDLGTSSLRGQLNFSLLDFKLRLGAEPSIKLSFEKQLA